ncbi:unnamed protein product, partial [Hymenolepis diminuta]
EVPKNKAILRDRPEKSKILLEKITRNSQHSHKLNVKEDPRDQKNVLWASQLTRGVMFDQIGRVIQTDNITPNRLRPNQMPKIMWSLQ